MTRGRNLGAARLRSANGRRVVLFAVNSIKGDTFGNAIGGGEARTYSDFGAFSKMFPCCFKIGLEKGIKYDRIDVQNTFGRGRKMISIAVGRGRRTCCKDAYQLSQ